MTSTDTAGQVEAEAWLADYVEHGTMPPTQRAYLRTILAALPADRLACGGGEVADLRGALEELFPVAQKWVSRQGWREREALTRAEYALKRAAARQSPAPATQAAGGGVVEDIAQDAYRQGYKDGYVDGRCPQGCADEAEIHSEIDSTCMLDGWSNYWPLATLSPASKVQTAGDEGDWQPIETAPHDRPVDLWIDNDADGYRLADATWGLPQHACGEAGPYCDSDNHPDEPGWLDSLQLYALGEDEIATHWRERPASPTLQGKTQ